MANRILIGSGVTQNYWEKAQSFKYFDTLNGIKQGRVQPFTILLGEWSTEKMASIADQFKNIRFIQMFEEAVVAPNPNKCLQHGAFIPTLQESMGLDETDYVIFTDSDITVQRALRADEEEEFLSKGRVFVATNWNDAESLLDEAAALQPTVPPALIGNAFPNHNRMQCFNTGVLGATVADWKRLLKPYKMYYPFVAQTFGHYARQQWLLSWLIHSLKMDRFDTQSNFVRSIHAHGHEPQAAERLAAQGVSKDSSGLWVHGPTGQPVLFAHNLLSG